MTTPGADREVWNQVRELSIGTPVTPVPAALRRPKSATVTVDGEVYHLVPDTGFSMVIAWLAGHEHLVRLLDLAEYTTKVTTIQDGRTRARFEPRSQSDQDIIDEGIGEYLTDADIPVPPRGYRWYQRMCQPFTVIDDLYGTVNRRLKELDPQGVATHPRDIAPLLDTIVTPLYRG